MDWFELIVNNNIILLSKSKRAGSGGVRKDNPATVDLYNIVGGEKAFKIFWSGPVMG